MRAGLRHRVECEFLTLGSPACVNFFIQSHNHHLDNGSTKNTRDKHGIRKRITYRAPADYFLHALHSVNTEPAFPILDTKIMFPRIQFVDVVCFTDWIEGNTNSWYNLLHHCIFVGKSRKVRSNALTREEFNVLYGGALPTRCLKIKTTIHTLGLNHSTILQN
jgi:hypothetical protein